MLRDKIYSPMIYRLSKKEFTSKTVFLLLFMQILGFALVLLSHEEVDNTTYILVLSVIAVSLLTNLYTEKITGADNVPMLIVNMLYSIGLIMLLRLNLVTGKYHMIWYLFSVAFFFIGFFIMNRLLGFFKDKFYFFFGITLFLFLITLGLAAAGMGAKNWIRISDNITVQPSEFSKISYIFMIGAFYNNYDQYKDHKFKKYFLMVATYLFIALFFLQGELGTAMVFFAVFMAQMFVFERRYLLFVINIFLAVLGLFLAYKIFPHIKMRFTIWENPWADPSGGGYQIIQSVLAIAGGGLFGSGLGQGMPGYIPVSESDFILSAIMEEMGIFMGIGIALLFIILIYKSVKIALLEKDIFYASIAFSVGLVFAVQSLIMFGGIINIIPLTGITTPFLSYGGSSMLSSFILLSVLQLASSRKRLKYAKEEK